MLGLFTRGSITCLGLIILWQVLVTVTNLPPYILPGPILVFTTWWQNIHIILQQTSVTLIETLAGLSLGALIGVFSALLLMLIKPVRRWLLPLLLISQAIPTFAIAPLLVVWFGYGMASKIATTVIMLFFPITSAFYDGLKRTEDQWLDMANVMGSNTWRTLIHIQIPAALPALASGLRVATAIAPIGAIVGEWVGSSRGLGYLMLNANARLQIDMMFAALLTLTVMTLVLYYLVDFGLKKSIFWQSEK